MPQAHSSTRVSAPLGYLIFACAVAAFIGGTSSLAAAHASLVETSPPNNEVIEAVPGEIVLEFDEAVRSGDKGVLVLDPGGAEVQRGDPMLSDDMMTATQPVSADARGTYTVSYRLISEDNHVISGSFVFHVGEITGAADVQESTYDTGWYLRAAGRALYLGGIVLGLGAVFVSLFVDRRRGERPILPARPVMIGVAVLTTTGAIVIVWGLGASLARGAVPTWSTLGETLEPTAPFGGSSLWLVAIALSVVVAVLVVATGSERESAARRWTLVACVAALGLVPSFTGHASAARDATVVVDIAHVFAAGAWAGGLLYLAVTHRSWVQDARGRSRLVRFSAVTTVTVVVVLASGLINTWVLSGGPGDFFGSLGESAYSTTLAVKLALVAVVLVLGLMNRRSVSGSGVSPWRRLRIEAVAVVAVVAVTGLLIGMVPPADDAVGEYQGVEQAGEVTVRMQVFPAATGKNEVHLYFLSLDGSLYDVAAAEMRISSGRVEPRRVPLTMVTASHAIAPQVDLTEGTWDFDITVVAPSAVTGGASFEVPIE